MKGVGWGPWRSARRRAPALEVQKGLAGVLAGAPPQGLGFRAPLGARWQARRVDP
ncbi:hypothetical protein KY290_008735 [Solanum tuberosum]|uniref:Uncharacterized protein n=1 Tax=Solanum tuberosum TaxID=4113 RepID=A0ABQ7W9E2_SOLTU|nr:hypothetical protein KY290_008735 [Solanum tuberosum]